MKSALNVAVVATLAFMPHVAGWATTSFTPSLTGTRTASLTRPSLLASRPSFAKSGRSHAVRQSFMTKLKAQAGAETVDALVIGSGVSGSSLGFSLQKRGVDVLVTEARDVVGGNVITREEDGFVWEEGPNTFQPTAQIMRMAVDLGIADELVFADHTLPRMVYWDGELYPLPAKPEDAPFFGLLNIFEKIRAGIGAIGLVAARPAEEESVKEFIERHLGQAVFRKIIDPFVSGVYAGDPAKLSMPAAFKKIYALEDMGSTPGLIEGGILRMNEKAQEARDNFDPELPTYKGGALGSFKRGLQTLPKTVAERLGDKMRTSWKVETVARNEDGTYTTTFTTPQGTRRVNSRTVAVTSPAYATSQILGEMVPEVNALNDIHYPCVYSVTLAYPKDALKDSVRRERPGIGNRMFGFGNLIPRSMGIRTLGTIWSSSLFPYRVPEGYEMMLSYIGGAQDPYNYDPPIADLAPEEVAQIVHGDVQKILLKPDAPQPRVLGVRKWPTAIPQYNKGYFDIKAKVDGGLSRCPGVFLGGNYMSGVAFGDCVQWGMDTAPQVEAYLAEFSATDSKEAAVL